MKIKSLSSLVLACVILVCGCRDPRQATPQLAPLPSGLTENEFAKQFAGVYHDKRMIGEERPDGSQESRNVKQYYIYKPDSSDQGVFYDVNKGEMTYSGTWNIDFFHETPRGSGYYEFKLLRFGNVPSAMANAGIIENDSHINVAVAGKDGFESSDLYTMGAYTARKVAEIDSKKLGQLESGRIDAAALAKAEIGGVSSQLGSGKRNPGVKPPQPREWSPASARGAGAGGGGMADEGVDEGSLEGSPCPGDSDKPKTSLDEPTKSKDQ